MVDCFLGEIRMFAGAYAPVNWHICDGTLLTISANQALFSLLGTSWGGNGVSTFALPNLQGRVPLGAGEADDLTYRHFGQMTGQENVSVTSVPVHTHAFQATTDAANLAVPDSDSIFAAVPDGSVLYTTATTYSAEFAADAVGITGEDASHPNIMPSAVISFIICMSGTYPSRAS